MKSHCTSNHLHHARKPVFIILYLLLLLLELSPGTVRAQAIAADSENSTNSAIPLKAMTQVNEKEHLGYFGDPYPVHVVPQVESTLDVPAM